MDLREQLQTTFGSAYTLERELGGGGMSRVFVAEETALGRKVVVKVLPPDLGASVNVDRFRREIRLAARLQHPHIVAVLTAGESNGLPYYTMPFVDGESLRARLARGPLPVAEVVGILRDVAKALAYAHERGIVHRDIKPDNVLLTGGSAVVTDFGIAKALSAARADALPHATHGTALTQMGSSIGTPAYMAPEQAAADPATDHRADLYAFGCMAYELLVGRPPFVGLPPQRLLAAQMAARPQPVEELRGDTPPMLADLLMRCLEKDANDRPQSAADLARVLETVTTSGGAHAAMAPVLLAGRMPTSVAIAAWAAATLAVGIVARAATMVIGLPDWVFQGALAVMAFGLPVILFTAFVHRTARNVLTATPTLTPGGTPVPRSTMATIAMKASPHVTWRRTWLGGVAAVGAFVALVAVFMALRALGIGPEGSLLAAGKVAAREPFLVTDFRAVGDTSLGSVVAEAVRADLAQSPAISLVAPSTITAALRRMGRAPDSRLDTALAREVAQREGIKVVVDGQVQQIGATSYLLTMRLVRADSGQELASYRATAKDAEALIPTIGALTRKLRGRIGESLRTVNASPPLEQVTTPSLPALRKYAEANAALSQHGDYSRFERLMGEAIALDSGFAMAYRKLAAAGVTREGATGRVIGFLQKAFDHRARLTEYERRMTEGSYYGFGPIPARDTYRAAAAFEAATDAKPGDYGALNNAGLMYRRMGNVARAESLYRQAVEVAAAPSPSADGNLVDILLAQGRHAAADSVNQRLGRTFPTTHPLVLTSLAHTAYARGGAALAEPILREAYEQGGDAARPSSADMLAHLALLQGRVQEAGRLSAESWSEWHRQGHVGALALRRLNDAWRDLWLLDERERAVRIADSVAAGRHFDTLPLAEGPYRMLTSIYAVAGRADRVRAVLADFERRASGTTDTVIASERHLIHGLLAQAERRYADAAREIRVAGALDGCSGCTLSWSLGYVYDLAEHPDSAIVAYSRYVDGYARHVYDDGVFLAGTHKRLGELWEAKGDSRNAASHYARFVELWKNADPELQPRVREVRQRLERLSRTESP
jgi:tRNA A-37 threonylcarbamoyl transferase component Bud32/tetratricopeptide (TPR) repeat protein